MIWLFFKFYAISWFHILCYCYARECLPLLGFQSLYADLLRLLWYLTHQPLNDQSFWKLIICSFPVMKNVSTRLKQRRFWAPDVNRKRVVFLWICHDATKFVFPSVFSLTETTCRKIRPKSRPKIANCLLPSSKFDKDIGRQEYPL